VPDRLPVSPPAPGDRRQARGRRQRGMSPLADGPRVQAEGIKRGSPGPGQVARGCLHAGNDAWW
jgi:hypothetical protein